VPETVLHNGELTPLVQAMHQTMLASHGVGLAANQVGITRQLLVIADRARATALLSQELLTARQREPVAFYALANPTYEVVGYEHATWFEGCLSVPGYTAAVRRPLRLRVRGADPIGGERVEFEATGWHARIMQHEIDHLRGILYVDRMYPRSFMTKEHYGQRFANSTASQIADAFE
jgi:peptide deformylase